MKVIYVESQVVDHPRTKKILERFSSAKVIKCDHYGEIFNIKAQNFRLQKQEPSLILAKKQNRLVLPTPEGFGIGGEQNYYFSHMLNCLYDCRYCFLQGMYHSANYVLFVNYEDFESSIAEITNTTNEKAYFFSGYDCDSLAYEPVTGFLESFLPFFAKTPNAILEIRTKSTNIKVLQKNAPIENCVVAFSFTPEEISKSVEHKVPSVSKRIAAMQALAKQGWQVGLRFDPLIYHKNFEGLYSELIENILEGLDRSKIHSVSVGPMRFPIKMFQKLIKLYPRDRLLAHPLISRQQNMTYSEEVENKMKVFVLNKLAEKMDQALIFECNAL